MFISKKNNYNGTSGEAPEELNFNNKFPTKICRLCLAQTTTYFTLIDNNKAAEMLEALTSLKILPSDEISTVMCLKCRLNLTYAYKIQQDMLKAEERFKQRRQEPLKEELIIEESVLMSPQPQESIKEDSEEVHDCPICNKTFPNNALLYQHKYRHLKKECPICGKEFSASNIQKHIQNHNRSPQMCEEPPKGELIAEESFLKSPQPQETTKEDSEEAHECPICSKTFPNKTLLYRHKYGHVKKKCPICGKELSASNLHKHIQSHTGSPQMCELCGGTFKSQNSMREHMFYAHHTSRHKCQYCDKVFKKRGSRDAHEKKEHLNEANFVCDTCGKKFYRAKHLNAHVKMTHLKLRPYVCEFCNSGFSSLHALKTHRRQHTNETPYRCEECGAGFRQKVSLKAHLKSIHKIVEEMTCECGVCGKGFASKVALYTHQRTH